MTSVGKGEAAVSVVIATTSSRAMTMSSCRWRSPSPAEGTGYEIGGMAIIKGAKNPELAKAWYDRALETSREWGKYTVYQGHDDQGTVPPKPELLAGQAHQLQL